MKILGINYLSESSVCLINKGKIEYAVSEERLNRKKNWYGVPVKSIKECLNFTKNNLKDIDYICTHGTFSYRKNNLHDSFYKLAIQQIQKSELNKKDKNFFLKKIFFRKRKEKKAYLRNKKTIEQIKKIVKKKIYIFDHHKCHAASAAYFSGWKKCLVLTADGYGDGSSSKLFIFENNQLKQIKTTSIINSLGYFYGSITKYLGFKPQRHEGKVLGLAAHGNINKAYPVISKLIYYDKKIKNFKSSIKHGYLPLFDNKFLKRILYKFSKKDIAAATQKVLEECILEYLCDLKYKNYNIALAGGIFANVKLNQKISELSQIKDLFIFPNMGDGGLSVGAAALKYIKNSNNRLKKIDNVYLGNNFSNNEILKEIKKRKLKYKKSEDLEIANILNEGKVVAIFTGRMEFGPRSLGNRSILIRATNAKINKTLNKKLNRTEFMPFAPVTLEHKKNQMYLNTKKGSLASRFMTITYKCTNEMKKNSPAAIHVDNTARPQFINKRINPKLFSILSNYYRISKIPNLINTSFNMHEEPIVSNPSDAIRAFLQSKIDYLLIEDYLISKKK